MINSIKLRRTSKISDDWKADWSWDAEKCSGRKPNATAGELLDHILECIDALFDQKDVELVCEKYNVEIHVTRYGVTSKLQRLSFYGYESAGHALMDAMQLEYIERVDQEFDFDVYPN